MNKFSKAFVVGLASLSGAVLALPASASPVIVSESAWGQNYDANMDNVFGAGNYLSYSSYAGLDTASVFSASNSFVFLEGGADKDISLSNYLASDGAAVLSWVASGGKLLLQSAGWDVDVTLNGTTLQLQPSYSHANSCGTLTAEGQSAFTFFATPANQCGSFLSHDDVFGAGPLTTFVTGDETGTAVVAGGAYGAGYIMYSGLTASGFNFSGSGLEDNLIAFTAQASDVNVPAPGALALLGLGLAGLFARRRKTA